MTGKPQNLLAWQQSLTRYIRDPDVESGPPGIEPRRLHIYRDLFFNTVENYLSNGFPVCRRLFDDAEWMAMIRDFLREHRCGSPIFMEVAEEFITYLSDERAAIASDPPFFVELAHYEWMEVVLDVSQAELPEALPLPDDLLGARWCLSPLAVALCYQYPVHRISVDFQPDEPPGEATFLVVYRNREDRVGFLEINAVTAKLMDLLAGGDITAADALQQLAAEMGMEPSALEGFASALLAQLLAADILLPVA